MRSLFKELTAVFVSILGIQMGVVAVAKKIDKEHRNLLENKGTKHVD